LAQAATIAEHNPEALAAAQTALTLARDLSTPTSVARALAEVAQTSLILGDAEGAGRALDEAERLAAADGDDSIIEMVTEYRGDWAVATGDLHGSLRANLVGLKGAYAAWAVASIAVTLVRLGRPSEALEVGAVAHAMARELGTDVDTLTVGFDSMTAAMDRARADLSAAEAARAEQAGRDLPAGQRTRRATEVVERCLSEADSAPTRRRSP
jgi:outer membrane murein-binding lipoprotein Lpp